MAAPVFPDPEHTRRASVVWALLQTLGALGALALTLSTFDAHNDVRVSAVFYGLVFLWIGVVGALVRTGRVLFGAWALSVGFWLLIATVSLLFGGLKGENAATFSVSLLVIGSVVGGRPAFAFALVTLAWCAFVAWLETNGRLPPQLGPYSPLNAWTALAVTFLLTIRLQQVSLKMLRQAKSEAEAAARARDQALHRSITAQKLEVVGQLANGIAHDFNNLLTVMQGSTAALRDQLEQPPADVCAALDDLDGASERAALMTRQLLAFGRSDSGALVPLDLAAVTREFGQLLPRLLGRGVTVELSTDTPAKVRATRAGLEQLLLNLAVNARDAMDGAGRLVLTVSVQGRFAELRAQDSGVGMDEATRSRLFEPFFTTKEKGTGLGLATVANVVQRFDGEISVESAPGRGATFVVRLPLAE